MFSTHATATTSSPSSLLSSPLPPPLNFTTNFSLPYLAWLIVAAPPIPRYTLATCLPSLIPFLCVVVAASAAALGFVLKGKIMRYAHKRRRGQRRWRLLLPFLGNFTQKGVQTLDDLSLWSAWSLNDSTKLWSFYALTSSTS